MKYMGIAAIFSMLFGILIGISTERQYPKVQPQIINQRDSLRNALDRAKLDSLSLEYYYQRKLKEVQK